MWQIKNKHGILSHLIAQSFMFYNENFFDFWLHFRQFVCEQVCEVAFLLLNIYLDLFGKDDLLDAFQIV